jgi:molybdate transport system substrate-binding protein
MTPLARFALGFALALPARAGDTEITVLAASSLTESLQAVGASWTAAGHPKVTFSFDASSRLAKQIEAAAPADLFFSADTDWMDYLAQRGLIDEPTRVNVLGNSLVVVVPAASTATFGSVKNLSRPEVTHLALAAETVPAGKYARAALTSAGIWEAVNNRVVNGENVRTVLGWVASNEAEAGFVYATDAKIEPKVKVALIVPVASYPPIVYPAAIVKSAAHARDATEFLAYCKSAEGMEVFLAAGFTPPAK